MILYQFCCLCIVSPPGYLIGYVSHRKPQTTTPTLNCDAGVELEAEKQQEGSQAVVAPVSDPQLDWKDITKLLKQKLTSQAFEKVLKYAVHVYRQRDHTLPYKYPIIKQTYCHFINK